MAPRSPTIAVAQIARVIDVANEQRPCRTRQSPLGMAPKAKILVPNGQQLGVNRTVRRVADGATLAQCGMFKYKGPGLFSVALGARFI